MRRSRTLEIGDLLASLESAAEKVRIGAPDLGSGKGKTYEIWFMLAIAHRCQISGIEVSAVDCRGSPVRTFNVRGGPGGMPSAGAGPEGKPCHLVLRGRRHSFELHLSLQHLGSSGSAHEIDLSLLSAREASAFRKEHNGGPVDLEVLLAVECKSLGLERPLDPNVVRALVGVMVDLNPFWHLPFVHIGRDRWSTLLVQPRLASQAAVVTTTRASETGARLAAGHPAVVLEGVGPGSEQHALDNLWAHLRKRFAGGSQSAGRGGGDAAGPFKRRSRTNR